MEKRREGGKGTAPASPSRWRDARLRPQRGHSPSPPPRRPSAPQLPSPPRLPLSPILAAPPRAPRRPRCPHPVPSRSPSRRRGPAPTSARRRAAASRAQSSGRVFQICKRGSGEAVSAGRAGAGGAAAAAELPARRPLSPCCGRRAAPAGQEELRRRLPRLRLAREGKGRAPPRPDPPARGSTPGPARPPPRGRLLPGPRPLPAAPRQCPRPSRRRPLGAPRRPRRPLMAAGS